MAEIAATLSERDAYNLTRCHRTTDFHSNQLLHVTDSMFEGSESELLFGLAGSSSESMECRGALHAGFWVVMQLFGVIESQIHPECMTALRGLEEEGTALYKETSSLQIGALSSAVSTRLLIDEQIVAAGAARELLAHTEPGDPCPCGSGQLYAECHREYHVLIEPWADAPRFSDHFGLRPDAMEPPA